MDKMTKNSGQPNNPHLTNRGVTLKSETEKTYAGIDYFTATCTKDAVGLDWMYTFNEHKNQSLDDGWKIFTKRQWGFDITYINGLSWGYSEAGRYLMTASGVEAHRNWLKVLPRASNVSRLDLHYTFRLPKEGEDLVERSYKKMLNKLHAGGQKKRSLITNSEGGQTLYIGSRKSDQFGRFYYKHSESQGVEPKYTYRLEVEYKKPRSLQVFNRAYDSIKSGAAVPEMVKDTVVAWFAKRGVELGLGCSGNEIDVQVSKILSTRDRKLKWLRTDVAPTLVELCGQGHYEDTAKAIGLTSGDLTQLAMFAPSFPDTLTSGKKTVNLEPDFV